MTTVSATMKAAGDSWVSVRNAMPLGDYVEMVLKDKGLDSGAHDYVYGAVEWAKKPEGDGGEGDARAPFGDLHTVADAVDRTVEYLKLAAWGDPMERRALVFSGPPASGAEAIWARIVEVVEAYSRSEEGRIYAIAGCPIAEDPLNLIEPGHRDDMVAAGSLQRGGGRLCPDCRKRFEDEIGGGSLRDIGVRRVVMGRDLGAGVALVSGVLGSCDVRLAAERSNRGVLVCENLTDSPREVVESVLDLAARRSFLGREGQSAWDGVVIASVDGGAFEAMCAEPSFTRARLQAHVVPAPYSLSPELEEAMYETHREGHALLSGVHFSPLTMQAVAHLAVATRRTPAASPAGMAGLGPGRSLSALEDCVSAGGVTCVAPLHAVSELAHYAEVAPEQVEEVVAMYARESTEVLRRAGTDGFEGKANDLLVAYRERLLRQLNPPQGAKPAVGEGETELRTMEAAVGLKEEDREDFRSEMGAYFERNPGGSYADEPRMKAAIESRLLHSLQAILKALREVAEGSDGRDGWARQRGAVHDRLVNTYGFCDVCAIDLVAMLLSTERPLSVKKGHLRWDWRVRFDAGEAKEELQKFRSALAASADQEDGVGC